MLWQDYYHDKNLSALIDSALNRNLTLYSSILQIEKANSYIRKANSSFWPSIDLRVSQNEIQRANPKDAFNQHGIGLTLS